MLLILCLLLRIIEPTEVFKNIFLFLPAGLSLAGPFYSAEKRIRQSWLLPFLVCKKLLTKFDVVTEN